jgi:dihydroorotase
MLEITKPDDFHHHFRDGDSLQDVTLFAVKQFKRVVAMPNLKPPVRTLDDARSYREQILAYVPQGSNFEPLMTLYLTDATTQKDIAEANESGIVFAAKLYPAGATTNSDLGVTNINNMDPVFQVTCFSSVFLIVCSTVDFRSI